MNHSQHKQQAASTAPKIKSTSENVFPEIPVSLEQMLSLKLSIGDFLDQIECVLLVDAIERSKGNQTQAAQMLGINRTTFIMKLRKLRAFDIQPEIVAVRSKYNHLFNK